MVIRRRAREFLRVAKVMGRARCNYDSRGAENLFFSVSFCFNPFMWLEKRRNEENS